MMKTATRRARRYAPLAFISVFTQRIVINFWYEFGILKRKSRSVGPNCFPEPAEKAGSSGFRFDIQKQPGS